MEALAELPVCLDWKGKTLRSDESKGCFQAGILFLPQPLEFLEPAIMVLDKRTRIVEKVWWNQVCLCEKQVSDRQVAFSNDLSL